MGTDCNLITNKKSISLDRWYVFHDHFENEKIYSEKDFLEKIIICRNTHIDDYCNSTNNFDPQYRSPDKKDAQNDLAYLIYWCQIVRMNAGEKNIFVDTNSDIYCCYNCDNSKLKLEQIKICNLGAGAPEIEKTIVICSNCNNKEEIPG